MLYADYKILKKNKNRFKRTY